MNDVTTNTEEFRTLAGKFDASPLARSLVCSPPGSCAQACSLRSRQSCALHTRRTMKPGQNSKLSLRRHIFTNKPAMCTVLAPRLQPSHPEYHGTTSDIFSLACFVLRKNKMRAVKWPPETLERFLKFVNKETEDTDCFTMALKTLLRTATTVGELPSYGPRRFGQWPFVSPSADHTSVKQERLLPTTYTKQRLTLDKRVGVSTVNLTHLRTDYSLGAFVTAMYQVSGRRFGIIDIVAGFIAT